jgi:hypothetical protein
LSCVFLDSDCLPAWNLKDGDNENNTEETRYKKEWDKIIFYNDV